MFENGALRYDYSMLEMATMYSCSWWVASACADLASMNSNYWPYGTAQKTNSAMLCCGEMRYGKRP